MPAAVVQETDMVPDAAPMTVEAAYLAVKALCDPEKTYAIDWIETLTVERPAPILSRFARALKAEAWLVARQVDADGKPVRGGGIPVCPVMFDTPASDEALVEIEQQLHDELAELKEADGA